MRSSKPECPPPPTATAARRRPQYRAVLAGIGLLLALLSAPLLAGDVEVITSPDRANIPLDRTLLRSIFAMRQREWPDGQPTHVFVLPDTSELHDLFCREQLGTYPYVLRSAWDRMVYTGTGFAPTVVDSEAEMRRRVASTPGAIGYVLRAGDSVSRGAAPAGDARRE